MANGRENLVALSEGKRKKRKRSPEAAMALDRAYHETQMAPPPPTAMGPQEFTRFDDDMVIDPRGQVSLVGDDLAMYPVPDEAWMHTGSITEPPPPMQLPPTTVQLPPSHMTLPPTTVPLPPRTTVYTGKERLY